MKVNKIAASTALCIMVSMAFFPYGNMVHATVGIPSSVSSTNGEQQENDADDSDTAEIGTDEYENHGTEDRQVSGVNSSEDCSSDSNRQNLSALESLQDSWEENPNGSRYTDDYAYYKVGGLTEQPDVDAPSAILMDATTGFVLYSKNATKSEDKKYYPASMTKVMTALIAIENGSMDDVITFSDNSINGIPSDATMAGFSAGDTATLDEVLCGLFMASGADSAVAIAEHYGGDVDSFVQMMNTKAQQLGCLDTHFVNPHGLHDANHYTTSYDMALIMREAIRYEDFRNVIGRMTCKIVNNSDTGTNVEHEIELKNRSALLSEGNENYYEFAEGSKTGHTNAAKYTLVSYASKNNETLICVVMEEDNFDNSYSDHRRLYEWGYKKTQVISPIPDQESVKALIHESVTDEKYQKIEQNLAPKYLSSYGVLTNTAINTDAVNYFFTYEEDMNEGILGYINISYYDKILIGRTPILYETHGDEYNNYISGNNTSQPPIVIGVDGDQYSDPYTDSETNDSSTGSQDSELYSTESSTGYADGEYTEDIDPFTDTSGLNEKSVAGQLISFFMIYGMLLVLISMVLYIIILCGKKKGHYA